MCYNFFMFSLNPAKVIWLFILLMLSLQPSLLALPDMAKETSSVIITFDPLIVKNKNINEKLADTIKNILINPDNGLINEVEKDGANWLFSSSKSGIQTGFIYPRNSKKPLELVFNLVDRLLEKRNELLNSSSTICSSDNFIEHCPVGSNAGGHHPISVLTEGSANIYESELRQKLDELNLFYQQKNYVNLSDSVVIQKRNSGFFRLITWHSSTSECFYTASFISKNFTSFINNPSCSYEIIYRPGTINLLLKAEAPEKELAEIYRKIDDFCQNHFRPNKKNDWEFYEKIARQILRQNLRDFNKTFLQKSWLKHWQIQAVLPADKLQFISPDQKKDVFYMPDERRLYFSRSQESFPRMVAAHNPTAEGVADIAIKFVASSQIISQIKQSLETDSPMVFPFSLRRLSTNSMMVKFNALNKKIVHQIAVLRSRIFNSLAEARIIKDLPAELSVSIAATSDLPPFLLRGRMTKGWPEQKANYSWRQANYEDIAEILAIKNSSRQSILRKWSLKTITGSAKAHILAELASKGLFINSFELH
ncbi:MAG: hypothetical protein ACQETH_09775 [Candidatus Rifleibacteriota bacterium]